MRFVIILGTLVCAAQAKHNVCEVGNPSEKCGPTQPFCQIGYECVDGNCCQAKDRLCQHNQRSHGLCDDNGQCPDPGHICFTTDDDQRVCCNKNQPTPKQRVCASWKPCESSEDCEKSFQCVDGSCCKSSDSADSDSCPAAYSINHLLGCYIFVKAITPVFYNDTKQHCATDGGRRLLVNSKEEADELAKLMIEEGVLFIPIQGSRSSGSSVWVTDDGSPLPYLPSTIDFEDNLSNTALVIFSRTDKYFFQAQDPTWRGYTAFACEIEK